MKNDDVVIGEVYRVYTGPWTGCLFRPIMYDGASNTWYGNVDSVYSGSLRAMDFGPLGKAPPAEEKSVEESADELSFILLECVCTHSFLIKGCTCGAVDPYRSPY